MSDILRGIRHGYKTDLSKGIACNADAALMLLHEAGGTARVKDIIAGLKAWRPEPRHFTYLFQTGTQYGGYGFMGTSFTHATNQVFHHPVFGKLGNADGGWGSRGDGHNSTRRCYYYRPRRGMVAISAEGLRRLAELSGAE